MTTNASPVEFSTARRVQLDGQCDDLINRTLCRHDSFHAASNLGNWQRVRRRDAMNVYRPRVWSGSEGPGMLLGSGIVPGTLDDALSGVYCDSTESLRVCKSLLSDKFVDGAMLRVFEAHDLRAPVMFAGIKWFVMQGFAGASGLLSDKDALTYERMGRMEDRNGRSFAYHVLQSIELPERPANRERGLQRVEVSWCSLYRQLSPDWVGVFMLGDLNVNTLIPQNILSFISAERVLSAGKFLRCAHAKKFSALIADNAGFTPEQGSPHCVVCLSSPPKMLGFGHKVCMGCRRHVCRKCRQRRQVFRLHLRTGKPATERFCRFCVDKVTSHGGAKSSAGLDEVHDVLRGGSRAGTQKNGECSGSEYSKLKRFGKLAKFTLQCHDSITKKEETIMWNQEELLEISQFLESTSNRSRRREQRGWFGCSHQPTLIQPSCQRPWNEENSGSSANSSGQQKSPRDREMQYDYLSSPSADRYDDESSYFEEEAVESGPWTECLPNECSGKWTVVFDEDRQEYVQIRVPDADPTEDELRGDAHVKHEKICIDELD